MSHIAETCDVHEGLLDDCDLLAEQTLMPSSVTISRVFLCVLASMFHVPELSDVSFDEAELGLPMSRAGGLRTRRRC